jgi:ACS family tartrate transporter-like MFS transporter
LSSIAEVTITDEVAVGHSAMRKATWHLIPLIALGYGIAYMDRINISFAALQMNQNLRFSNTVFGIGAGIFFLSYAVCEIPSNLLLYKMGARRWLSRIMLTWGLLAVGMAFVHTPWQFYGVRFLLGMAEAGFFPGILFYLTQWFPSNLRARTISRFYVALPLSAVFMGGVAGALFKLDGLLGMRGWQWLFLVEGAPAVLMSAVFMKFLPNGPEEASWLSAPERKWIATTLAAEDIDPAGSHATGVGSALRDPRVWLFGLTNLLMLGVNYGSTFVLPDMIRSLTSLNVATVGYIISSMGLLGAVAMLLNAWLADRSGRSFRHMVVPSLLEAACLLTIAFTAKPWIAVPVLALMYFSHNAIQGPLLAFPSTFLKGRGAAAGLATINMVGMCGGFLYPPMMGKLRDLTGNYRSGFVALSATMLTSVAVLAVLHSWHRRPPVVRSVEVVSNVPS